MHFASSLFTLAAISAVVALPAPSPDNHLAARMLNLFPSRNTAPIAEVQRRAPEPAPVPSDDGTCVGSSFSPTNCDSPGAQSINVDPDVNVSPDINLERRSPSAEPQPLTDGTCVGSSFSPTNCDSPGAQSINVDPSLDVSPSLDLDGITGTVDDVLGNVL